MANSLHLDEDNHNPGAQNIEIIERVRLKGHQNHFILECGGESRLKGETRQNLLGDNLSGGLIVFNWGIVQW